MEHGPLYATLTKAAFHRRLSLTLRLLLQAGGAILLSLLVLLAADNVFNLAPLTRIVVGLVFLGSVAAGLTRLYLLYWRRPVDPAKMAVYLEQRYGIGDNRLVNAVHFDRDPSIPARVKSLFDREAETCCADMDFRSVWRHADLNPALRLCAVGMLAFLVYALPFGPHARNAFLRYLHPSSDMTPLNYTQFSVSPGDAEVLEGRDCPIRVRAAKFGRGVGGLDLLVREGSGEPLLYPMRSETDGFMFELRDLAQTTRYAVKNGNDASRWYTVTVVPRPRLDRLEVTITPPAYAGAAPVRLSPDKRDADALVGSRIRVQVAPARGQQIRFLRDGKQDAADVGTDLTFDLSGDTTLAADVRDAHGRLFANVWQCRFKAVPDRRPDVRFLNRELNVEIGAGASLPLSLRAGDDLGLTALELYTVRNQKEIVLKHIDYRDTRKDRDEVSVLAISEDVFARNAGTRSGRACSTTTRRRRTASRPSP
jgi:hypothetical protein